MKKNKKKNKPVDMRKRYIEWQRQAIAQATNAVALADYGHITDREARLSINAMEFALIFGWELSP